MLFKVEPELLLGKCIKVMPCKQHGSYPGNATYYIIKTEFLFVHTHYAGYYWRKCAYERKEPGKYDCSAPMLFIKLFCLVEVFFLEQEPVPPVKHSRAHLASGHITNSITEYPCYDTHA